MRKSLSKLAIALITVTTVLSVTGCQSLTAAIAKNRTDVTGGEIQLDAISRHLQTMRTLNESGYQEKLAEFERVTLELADAASSTNELRYALALATPGHPSTDLTEAHKILQRMLSEPSGLFALERDLAYIVLKELEHTMILEADVAELARGSEQASDAAAATKSDARRAVADLKKRLNQTEGENVRLRQELEEALNKLDAITNIELSSERPELR